ncbi:hypothetical protein SCLCIDRAFT_920599 [Scleroderma citrinum Foug A]|uniref:Uncharacterized protein n=1 Tax=Scleroderma citrinum Foug A TaxID=1036808 RepID=A0A0C3DYS7_9AGAM|nr:hypothetical protein SCLCIDRAFT_920599 [Scleroderma citrinum Foug A]
MRRLPEEKWGSTRQLRNSEPVSPLPSQLHHRSPIRMLSRISGPSQSTAHGPASTWTAKIRGNFRKAISISRNRQQFSEAAQLCFARSSMLLSIVRTHPTPPAESPHALDLFSQLFAYHFARNLQAIVKIHLIHT